MLLKQLTKLEFFENLKKLFPFITLWILLLSATKELVYYFGFKINILHYLEFSELTYLFLDDIMIWVLSLFSFLGIASLEYFDNKFKLKNINHNPFHFYLFVILNLFIYLIVEFLDGVLNNSDLYLIACFATGTLFFIYFSTKFKNSFLVKLSMIIPVSFLLVFFTTKYNQSVKLEGTDDTEVILEFDKKPSVFSGSNNRYIGQTNNYVFFYNLKKKETTVYFKKEISKMIFSEN